MHGLDDGRLGPRGPDRRPRRRAGPGRQRRRGRAAVAELRAARRPLDRPGARVHRAGRRGRAPRRCWSSTGPAGSQANADGFATMLRPLVDKLTEKKRADRARPGRRLAGHRRRGRAAARLPGRPRCSASSTRSTTPGRPAARWSRPTSCTSSASSSADPARLPALGLPARGDPPGAVHRRAVDARPPVRADPARSPTPSSPSGLLDDGLKRVAEAVRGGGGGSLLDVARARRSRRRSSTGSPA